MANLQLVGSTIDIFKLTLNVNVKVFEVIQANAMLSKNLLKIVLSSPNLT